MLEKARNARRGEEFRRLFDYGDISSYDNNHSRADFALCKMLAFWTGWDAHRIESLFNVSALGKRRKWTSRPDYRQRTISNAIAATPNGYQQEALPGSDLDKAVALLQAHASALPWKGRSGPTDRATFGAIVEHAARYGTLRKSGIVVGIDTRTAALEAGVSLPTAWKSLQRLCDDRKLLRRLRRKRGTQATTYLLKLPENATQGLNKKPCVDYVKPLRSLRNPSPAPTKPVDKRGRPLSIPREALVSRVGKLAALLVERVAAADEGGTTVEELAKSLERRACDVRRKVRYLVQHTNLLTEDAGRLCVTDDFGYWLQVELEVSGCHDAYRRDRARFVREREAYLTRGERPPDEAPSPEELRKWLTGRTCRAFEAFCCEHSGPQMVLRAYLDRKTYKLEYVIKAVAYFYHDLERWALWEAPVRRAMRCYAGWPMRSERQGEWM